MNYDRVFTFGCSFTQFFWPTWSDIIEYDMKLPTQNWGLCGLGNVGIAHRLLEADATHKFTERDLIMVLWSTWPRECRFINGQWQSAGNIFNNRELYNKKFQKTYWSANNDIIKNVGAIHMAGKSFPITYQATLHNVYDDDDIYSNEGFYNMLSDNIDYINSLDSFSWTHDKKSFDGAMLHVDNHPDIEAHLKFVEECIYPKINRVLKDSTREYYMRMHNKVIDMGKSGITKKEITEWAGHHNKGIGAFFKRHFDFDGESKRHGIPFNK
jgi:hypothetical protein